MISVLLPYLQHIHGKWIDKFFTGVAIDRAREVQWDPIKQQVWSHKDNQVLEMLNTDNEFHFVEIDTSHINSNQRSTHDTQELIGDNDLISTFHPKRKQTQSKQHKEKGNQDHTPTKTNTENPIESMTEQRTLATTVSPISTIKDELSQQFSLQIDLLRTEIKEDMQAEMRKLNSMFLTIIQQNSQEKAGGQGILTGNQ
mmetsp:Transcript_11325/g.17327  ORF Transcript_11325/g.17327 Transcript_11325/m.17327 type:complete len:199 (-) Transcript_11325:139-735(-)